MTTPQTPHLRRSTDRSSLRVGLLLVSLLLAYFALSQQAHAVVPAPDGGYPGGNTAEGSLALLSLTTGTHNTALGLFSLRSNTTGNFNTATGAGALLSNTADQNTATGAGALLNNTIGIRNTANGVHACLAIQQASKTRPTGYKALFNDTKRQREHGQQVLFALFHNTTGHDNAANGQAALVNNTTGNDNTADGVTALDNNTTGSNNIAVGSTAGFNLQQGDFNIDIGNGGAAGEAFTIRIGDVEAQTRAFIAGIFAVPVTGTGVVVDSDGRLRGGRELAGRVQGRHQANGQGERSDPSRSSQLPSAISTRLIPQHPAVRPCRRAGGKGQILIWSLRDKRESPTASGMKR